MPFCRQCGMELKEGVRFCPGCGTPVEEPARTAQQNSADRENSFESSFAAAFNTADTTAQYDPADVEKNKAMGVLAYLSWLVLIPIFAAKDSRFARFHANQGLVLLIASAVFGVVRGVLSAILLAISEHLYFVTVILSLLGLVFLALTIIGIVNAATGKAKELPVIGQIRILK